MSSYVTTSVFELFYFAGPASPEVVTYCHTVSLHDALPISYVQVAAAAGMVDKAARLFDAGDDGGTEANMAKMLASEASWYAADMCIQTHGGFGFAEERSE